MNTDPKDAEDRLRIAIAEKMGWTNLEWAGPMLSGFHHSKKSRTKILVPNYLTDPAAALLLVEHMRKEENGGWLSTHVDNDDGTITWVFYQKHRSNRGITATAPTIPLAICHAFALASQLDIQ